VLLSTLGDPKSEHLVYESESEPADDSAIYVDGRWAAILRSHPSVGGRMILECRRVYRFAMVGGDGEPVLRGDYFHDEATIAAGVRFMPDESVGKVVRVIRFQEESDDGFDGTIVVEPFDD
jgi:hypothetical protein